MELEKIVLYVTAGCVLGLIFLWLASKKHKQDDDFFVDLNWSRKPEWQADDNFFQIWDIEGGITKQEEEQ